MLTTTHFICGLPDGLYAWLELAAAREGVSLSTLVTQALRAYRRQQEQTPPPRCTTMPVVHYGVPYPAEPEPGREQRKAKNRRNR